ncbi:MAG: amino acid ABC transporter substrate-binding protein [Actinobacteria bacterium]|nr:amino acid ABC transporter substrate-binding protein [Actinomycetota bacterium]
MIIRRQRRAGIGRSRALIAALLTLALGAAGCAGSDPLADDGEPSRCAPDRLPLTQAGTLIIGTDTPAHEPWFEHDDPSNGQGFESAVAYAVAENLGFRRDQVSWVVAPLDTSYLPGKKPFDFDVNEISITPERLRSVSFSSGYYAVSQAVITMRTSPFVHTATVAELRRATLGAQEATTSLDFVNRVVKTQQAAVTFRDAEEAKAALLDGRIDGLVTDLPTAFALTAAEIPNSAIVGQFEPDGGSTEQLGLLLERGNPLVTCLNQALTELRSTGQLQRLEDTWLVDSSGVPRLG